MFFHRGAAGRACSPPRPLPTGGKGWRFGGSREEKKSDLPRRSLIDRQREAAGLKTDQLTIPDETLAAIIRRYTREAGVRQLERALGRVARRIALRFAEAQTDPVTVAPGGLIDLLGPEKVALEEARRQLPPGVATGLAWTEAGGDVLYVEGLLLEH